MIKLTHIKPTDPVRKLRSQINNMQYEIMDNQPFVGLCQNISINFYNVDTLVESVTASSLMDEKLYALCFPESNGVFVAKVWGSITVNEAPLTPWTKAIIDIPAVKLPTRDAVVATFVPPSHFGFNRSGDPNSMKLGPLAFATNNNNTDLNNLSVTIAEHDTTCDVTLMSGVSDGIDSSYAGLILNI